MKKRKIKRKNYTIDYGNDSIDITKECCKYLLDNNFYGNDEKKNIELLEKALILYSARKISNWDNKKNDEIIELCFSDLSSLLEIVDNHIQLKEEKEEFFAQYTHCIIYIYSRIKDMEPIEWNKIQSNNLDYTIIKNNNNDIIKLITGLAIQPYQISLELLKCIKTYHPQKRIIF